VEAGAETNPKVSHPSDLPIMIAVRLGNPEIVRTLLDHGAFPSPFREEPFKGRCSAFYEADYRGHREIAGRLLACGFELDGPLETGLTPLMLAAREGNADLVDDFLAAGARPDLTDERGRTALCWAVAYNVEAHESERVVDECHPGLSSPGTGRQSRPRQARQAR
jgi:ankyrin repeat protein